MPKESLTVRTAIADDYESIAKLIHQSHTISFAPFASREWVESRLLSKYRDRWKELLSGNHSTAATFVAHQPDGTIVGTVRVASLESNEFDAQLNGMHVEPSATGHGIGSMLMERAIEFMKAQAFTNVELGVIASNDGARRFYEKHGWQLHNELPDGIEGVPIAISSLKP